MTEKTVTIQRGKRDKDNPYFVCRRATAQDRSLSFEARGMLWYLLSKPDDWKVQPADLEQQCGSNRVYRILNELIKAGYIVRNANREQGRIISWTYLVYEQPFHDFQEVEKPDVENSDSTEYRESTEKRKEQKKSLAPVSQDAEETPKSAGHPVNALIAVWADVNQVIGDDPYKKKGYRQYAQALAEKGITPEQLREFLEARKSEPFWASKCISWSHVAENIGAWLNAPVDSDRPADADFWDSVSSVDPDIEPDLSLEAYLPDKRFVGKRQVSS